MTPTSSSVVSSVKEKSDKFTRYLGERKIKIHFVTLCPFTHENCLELHNSHSNPRRQKARIGGGSYLATIHYYPALSEIVNTGSSGYAFQNKTNLVLRLSLNVVIPRGRRRIKSIC